MNLQAIVSHSVVDYVAFEYIWHMICGRLQ